MYLNSRASLDPRWVKHHRSVPAGFMLATITVIRKNPNVDVSYNYNTGQWTGGFNTVWTGKARVQPYGIIGDELVAQDTTGRRLMRVQIADMVSSIHLDDMISIAQDPAVPELSNFTLEVRGTIGSSDAWLTDLVCEANMKEN